MQWRLFRLSAHSNQSPKKYEYSQKGEGRRGLERRGKKNEEENLAAGFQHGQPMDKLQLHCTVRVLFLVPAMELAVAV